MMEVIYTVKSLALLLHAIWLVKEPTASRTSKVKYAECLYKHAKDANSKYGLTNPKFASLQEAKEFFTVFANYRFVVEQSLIENVKYAYKITVLDGTNGILMKFFYNRKIMVKQNKYNCRNYNFWCDKLCKNCRACEDFVSLKRDYDED